ncbi:hypothetical protein [Metabacillus iocasae]|uniref:Vacuolar-type H+-ATPase subunit I/STV1 n=1 Tax=Priestia iocasae TaxID=2291674 RepID=A0ABS2QU40_9BACI|nr:hypothetical protein [Metabacillus iocasae]MBM7703000.1 vacuolar-type H+-ATPase subunit I/STV1 [Metabacillus iocasae]
MKKVKWTYVSGCIVAIGFPVFFLLIGIWTGDWGYALWSVPPALMTIWGALVVSRKQKVVKD